MGPLTWTANDKEPEQLIIQVKRSNRTVSVLVEHLSIHEKTSVMLVFVGLSIFQMSFKTILLLIGGKTKKIEDNI